MLYGKKSDKRSYGRLVALLLLILMIASLLPAPADSAGKRTITIRDPNGGEVLIAGSTYRISWFISDSGGYIHLYYTTEGDDEYEFIDIMANNPYHGIGGYDWQVPPNVNSTHCKVHVAWVSSLLPPVTIYATDSSDENFTIKQDVVITFKETPSVVSYGKYYLTTFDLYDPRGMVAGLRFSWKVDNGSGWTSWQDLPGNFDFYDPHRGWIWWSPSYYESADAQMRVQALASDRTTVLSEDFTSTFKVISPSITLIQPDGGVTLVGGSTYTIKWRTSEDPEEVILGVHIQYSLDGGSNWNSLGYFANSFEYDWTVPNVASNRVRVRVASYYGEWYTYDIDESSGDNRIITDPNTPTVTLIDPNPPVDGGVVMGSGERFPIRYSVTGAGNIDSIRIDYSTNNGSTYTTIDTITGTFPGIYYWTVPEVDTYQGRIRLVMHSSSYPDMTVVSNHAFYIFNTIEFNRPPVAMAGDDLTAQEGETVHLSAYGSYDPDGDPLTYTWTQIEPDFLEADLSDPHSPAPYFTPEGLTSFPVTFLFELEVSDGYDHEGVLLYNVDRVRVTVTPRPPTLLSFTPDTGWEGTPLTLSGLEMRGAEVYIGDTRILRIPDDPYPANPDPDHTFNLTIPSSVPPGKYHISLKTPTSESISSGEIEIFPRPTWNFNYGLGFHNPTRHLLSYPWNPWGEGRYKDAFGNQVYLTAWVCVGIPYWTPWDGWECLGYEVEEPFAPDPIAAIYYGAVFCWIARFGECYGMSSTALLFYHGDISVSDYDPPGSTKPSQLENGGELRRLVDWRQGSEMSAEVLNAYLDTLISGLVPSSEITGLGLWVNTVKSYIDSGELGIATMICSEGAHAVVPYAYQEDGDKIRFYVYDSNREQFSDEATAIEYCINGNDANDNPPYIEIDRSGIYWEWSFRSVDGSLWKDKVGLAFVPYHVIAGDRTLPLSIEGITQLLAGDATVRVENEEGNVSGVGEDGEILWGIEGAAPLPIFSGRGYLPQSYYLPPGNYTVHVDGNASGVYNLSLINNGKDAISIENAEVSEDSRDTVRVTYPDGNPYRGYIWYGTEDEGKEYDAKVVHRYEHGSRVFRIIGADLTNTGEHGIGLNDNYTGLKFTNGGSEPVTFDVEFQGSVICQKVWNGTDPPEPPHLPTARRENITVGPGETVVIMPLNWLDLDHTIVVVEGEGPPSSPLNLSALFSEEGVSLSWTPPAENGGFPVLEYRIYRGESPDNMTLLATAVESSYKDKDIVRGRTYYYAVSAVNVLGEGPLSDAAAVTIPELTPPSVPLNLKVERVKGGVKLTWDPPGDDGGSPVTGYIIYRGEKPDRMEKIAEVEGATEYLDRDVESGKTYYYSVSAVNSVGEGDAAPAVSLSIPEEGGLSPLLLLLLVALLLGAAGGYFILRRGRGVGPPEE
ncbi:MAG: hypothetical protein DRN40_01675 [Thermoplasmata archaeon]|nr:MAG: hypothetical protein DRN40_01675 [Thermoplasmata archaeon]